MLKLVVDVQECDATKVDSRNVVCIKNRIELIFDVVNTKKLKTLLGVYGFDSVGL